MNTSKRTRTVIIVLAILLFPSLLYVTLSSGKHHIDIPESPVPATHRVPAFRFIDQFGRQVSDSLFQNDILVFSFYCVGCGGESDRSQTIVKDVAEHFFDKKDIKYISINVNPADTSSQALLEYIRPFGELDGMWYFVTGRSGELAKFVEEGLLIGSEYDEVGKPFGRGLATIVIVDKGKHIRGYYDGTQYVDEKKIIDMIKFIRLEEYRKNAKRRDEQFERKR